MTNEELEKFTDVMVEKAKMHGWVNGRFHMQPGDEIEAFRGLIQNVVADTYLLVSGSVPLERWLESEEAP